MKQLPAWHGAALFTKVQSTRTFSTVQCWCAPVVPCRYKDFLDSVTPSEWFVAQAEKQEVS